VTKILAPTECELQVKMIGAIADKPEALKPTETSLRVHMRKRYGRWIWVEPAIPKWAIPPAPPKVMDMNSFLDADAELAVSTSNPALIRLLIKQGLNPLVQRPHNRCGWSVLEDNAIHNRPLVAAAIMKAMPVAKDGKSHVLALEHALEDGYEELLRALAAPPDQRKLGVWPTGVIEAVFDVRWDAEKVIFASINGADLPDDVFMHVRGTLPRLAQLSEMEEGNFATSQYRHRLTKTEGPQRVVTLSREPDGSYSFRARQITGPALAGGGTSGTLILRYGRWLRADTKSWDE
jgi:hypothetical protein